MMITLAALALAAQSDPLAPARDGMVQCYDPAPAEKRCRAMGSYEFLPDGTIMSLSANRLQDTPPVVMFARSAVALRDGKECTVRPFTAAEIEGVQVAGQPLPDAALAGVRDQIISALPAVMTSGAPMCSTYTANADGTLTATVDIEGVAHPEFTSTLRWVDPAEGWRIHD